jgi:hypothetical protein
MTTKSLIAWIAATCSVGVLLSGATRVRGNTAGCSTQVYVLSRAVTHRTLSQSEMQNIATCRHARVSYLVRAVLRSGSGLAAAPLIETPDFRPLDLALNDTVRNTAIGHRALQTESDRAAQLSEHGHWALAPILISNYGELPSDVKNWIQESGHSADSHTLGACRQFCKVLECLAPTLGVGRARVVDSIRQRCSIRHVFDDWSSNERTALFELARDGDAALDRRLTSKALAMAHVLFDRHGDLRFRELPPITFPGGQRVGYASLTQPFRESELDFRFTLAQAIFNYEKEVMRLGW